MTCTSLIFILFSLKIKQLYFIQFYSFLVFFTYKLSTILFLDNKEKRKSIII